MPISSPTETQNNLEYIQGSLGAGAQLNLNPPVPSPAPAGSQITGYGQIINPSVPSTNPPPQYTRDASGNLIGPGITPVTDPTSQATAYQELLSQAQNEISSIEQSFQPLFNQASIDAQKRQGSVDALVAAGMVAGTAGAQAATEGATEASAQESAQIQSQMEQQINAVYSDVEKNSVSLAQLGQSEEATAQQQIATIQAAATKNLDTMASMGISATALQTNDPNLYNQLQTQTGFTDFQMQSYIQSKMPAQYQPQVSDHYYANPDGTTTLARATFDPVSKTMKTDTYIINVPFASVDPNEIIKGTSGELLAPGPNNTYIRLNPMTAKEFQETGGAPVSPTSGASPAGSNINIYGIKTSSTTTGLGGTDSGITAADGGTFLASQGAAGDRAIAYQLLMSYPQTYGTNMTVDQALKQWSGGSYGAEILKGTVDGTSLLTDLDDTQIGNVLDAIKAQENIGSSTGTAGFVSNALNTLDDYNGKKYITNTDLTGYTATQKSQIVKAAAAQGIKMLTPKDSDALKTIQAAVADMSDFQTFFQSNNLLPTNWLSQPKQYADVKLNEYLQTNNELGAYNTWKLSVIPILAALKGTGSGGGGGAARLFQTIGDLFPEDTDTLPTANSKISHITDLLNNGANSIIGVTTPPLRTENATSTPSGATSTVLMFGPDGEQYNVPSDQIDAFTAAGGHK